MKLGRFRYLAPFKPLSLVEMPQHQHSCLLLKSVSIMELVGTELLIIEIKSGLSSNIMYIGSSLAGLSNLLVYVH